MRLKKVINLFGGPGIGKSTLAADLFSSLKKKHYEVELITEYAKDLTWEKRKSVLTGDQLYVFAKQHRRLLRIKDQVDIAICDSPLLLPIMYINEDADLCSKDVFSNTVCHIFQKYPNVNFFIERNPLIPYMENGRNQNEYEASLIDNEIINFLESNNQAYTKIKIGPNSIFDILKEVI